MDWNKNNWQEIYKNMSPQMREQMMNMAKAKIKEKLTHWFSQPILIVVSIAMGAAIGALMAFFGQVLLAVTGLREAHPLYFIPGLAIIGVLTLLAYKKWGYSTSRGIDLVFNAAHGKESKIPLRLIPMVGVATWLTHLFGGSAGREGVALEIGGTLGYNISKKIPLENASRILLVAGMAAGFAGLFQTPMAAIALAIEVLLVGHLELNALLPATAAAYSAYKVSELLGLEKLSIPLNELFMDWKIADLFFVNGSLQISLVLKLAILGILCGIIGGGFGKILQVSKKILENKIPNPFKRIAIVGLILSFLLLIFEQGRYAGLGTNLIQICFAEEGLIHSWDWILKLIFTIATVSVGFKGGEVTPLFAIGATFGIFVAGFFGIPAPLAAALCFAAVFGGATNTLFAPIFIGAEIFGFDALPGFFIVCVTAYVCNGGMSIYSQKKLRIR